MTDAFFVQEKVIRTAPVDNNATGADGSGDKTIKTVAPGKMFIIYSLFLQSEGTVDVVLKSGSTVLWGPIGMTAGKEFFWANAGAPLFRGVGAGDDIILNFSADQQVQGWITYTTAQFVAPSA